MVLPARAFRTTNRIVGSFLPLLETEKVWVARGNTAPINPYEDFSLADLSQRLSTGGQCPPNFEIHPGFLALVASPHREAFFIFGTISPAITNQKPP